MSSEELTTFTFKPLQPSYMLSFNKDGKQVGTFDFNEGRMHFEGDLSESGQVFVDWVLGAFKQRIDDAFKAERQRFALECIDLVAHYGGPVQLEAAIRARSST